jgi:hypothetical protein
MTTAPQSRRGGRPVLGAISGFLFGIFLAFDLLMMGTFRLDSIMVEVIPILGLLLGLAGGIFSPLKFLKRS